ncbi:MAG: hypothetical protein PVJ74_12360 [Gammaproteobacteria bacterium]
MFRTAKLGPIAERVARDMGIPEEQRLAFNRFVGAAVPSIAELDAHVAKTAYVESVFSPETPPQLREQFVAQANGAIESAVEWCAMSTAVDDVFKGNTDTPDQKRKREFLHVAACFYVDRHIRDMQEQNYTPAEEEEILWMGFLLYAAKEFNEDCPSNAIAQIAEKVWPKFTALHRTTTGYPKTGMRQKEGA